MTSLIEAIARALSEEDRPGSAGDFWEAYTPAAQAALKAISESGPTPEMIEAAPQLFNYDPNAHGTGWGAYYPRLGANAESIFRAMIQAAMLSALPDTGGE